MNPDTPALPDAEAGTNTPPFLTVTELAQRLKATVESQFDFVRIRAETRPPAPPRASLFTLKDDRNTPTVSAGKRLPTLRAAGRGA